MSRIYSLIILALIMVIPVSNATETVKGKFTLKFI